jgi:hypothetical protein
MLNEAEVLARYRENYEMAIEDGHAENASKVAWQWTEEEVMRRFVQIRGQHKAAQQEAVNLAHFG